MTISFILQISAAVLAGAALATFLLPGKVKVTRSAVVAASPAEVIAMASSTEGYQRFNPYKATDPNLKIIPFGPASGTGSGFHFEGKEGKGSQTVASVTADKVTYAIDLGPMGQPTQSIAVRPVSNGTEVTWSMEADMGLHPIFRVFGLFMDRMMGAVFTRGLSNIANA